MKRRLQYCGQPEGMHVTEYDWIDKEFGKVDNVELSLQPLPLPPGRREVWTAFDREPEGVHRLPPEYYRDVLRRRLTVALDDMPSRTTLQWPGCRFWREQ